MSRYALTLAVAVALACPAVAVPEKLKVQPDSLPFGTLRVGGVAEGSFLIFASADDPNPTIKTQAPKFVTVLKTGTHPQEFGKGNRFTCVTVEVSISTATAGELKGEVEVTIGDATVKVPVSATVKEKAPGAPRLLVVGTPFERYSTSNGTHFAGWTAAVDAAGIDASYLLTGKGKPAIRDLDLSQYDCVLVGDALVSMASDDVKRLRVFAERGGRLVVAANSFMRGSVEVANTVLDGYGVSINDVETQMAQEVEVEKKHFAAEVTAAGVEKVKFRRASPVKAGTGARVLVGTPEFEEPEYGYVGLAKAGKGTVVALGVSLWWAWPGEPLGKGTDNGKLLGFLLAAKREDGSLVADGAKVEKLAGGFKFTEGPAPDADGNVYFTDQPNDRILKWSVADGKVTTFMEPCGRSNGLAFDKGGTLWACADEKNELWKIDVKTKRHTVVVKDFGGKLLNGPNDIWVRDDGSAFFTDPYYKRSYWKRGASEQPSQGVFFLAADGKLSRADAGELKQANGIIGTPDGKTLYVADIGGSKTYRYDIEKDGSLKNRKQFCAQGSDGMTIDEQGNVYLTGRGVTVYDKDGKKVAQLDVAEQWTANVCFGGKDMKTLFITASTGLYGVKMKVKGAARQ